MNSVIVSKEDFTTFLKNICKNNVINDWLSLARSEPVSINDQQPIKRSDIGNAIVKFSAFFVSFSHFVSFYNLEFYKKIDSTIEDDINLFIADCESRYSELIEGKQNDFKNLWNVNQNLMGGNNSAEELNEYSDMINSFFEKLKQL